ncbi:class IV adenylate cyclase [Nonomuraea jabiensis]|uniref:Adenylate cyclase class 2 n=1 Tax=Nonomuraea jabiensis TaxID=882448 RepID=A0A7W9G4T7_9ACTN|nr:class IV adenylate cyclase [Nonomuraea jabiensis]MBB5777260.1 adenylate cyclase class 2 [Nonomuraea jabiensis]
MRIEAELKARLRDPDLVRETLDHQATSATSIYRDTYYDCSDGSLTAIGRELRVRTVTSNEGRRVLLTHKSPMVDEASHSKPEDETEVADAEAIDTILRSLGYNPYISFEKHCVNWQFRARGRAMLATMVTVPELDGTFLEIETIVDSLDQLPAALEAVRLQMYDLGITEDDLSTMDYTEAVTEHRDHHQATSS